MATWLDVSNWYQVYFHARGMAAPGDFWVQYKMLGPLDEFEGFVNLTLVALIPLLNGSTVCLFWGLKVHHESMQVACTPLNEPLDFIEFEHLN